MRKEITIDWQPVEKLLAENTNAGNLLAILEAEKIFQEVLHSKGVSRRSKSQENLNFIKDIFSNYQGLQDARLVMQKILEVPSLKIDEEKTKEILTNYYQAVTDLQEAEKISFYSRFSMEWKKWLKDWKKKLYIILGVIMAFFLVVLLLDRTSWGQNFTQLVVAIAEFIYFKLLIIVGIVIGVIIIIFGTIYYWESKQKKEKRQIQT